MKDEKFLPQRKIRIWVYFDVVIQEALLGERFITHMADEWFFFVAYELMLLSGANWEGWAGGPSPLP